MTSTYDFTATGPDGSEVPLRDYAGKVLLIVNVASKCGLTPQYEGLESLYRDDKDRGLEILGFPCNQFKGQEPGTDEEIQDFCKTTYDVTFPVFSKIEVNGPDADPLYQYLRAAGARRLRPRVRRLLPGDLADPARARTARTRSSGTSPSSLSAATARSSSATSRRCRPPTSRPTWRTTCSAAGGRAAIPTAARPTAPGGGDGPAARRPARWISRNRSQEPGATRWSPR